VKSSSFPSLEHMLANHLLDRFGRVALVDAAGGSQQGKVETAPDDGCHGRELLTPRAEPPGVGT
jgi:hypothetical protein